MYYGRSVLNQVNPEKCRRVTNPTYQVFISGELVTRIWNVEHPDMEHIVPFIWVDTLTRLFVRLFVLVLVRHLEGCTSNVNLERKFRNTKNTWTLKI